ncbi:hypothetical protein [Flammeovirga sp. OC4]|uniref:hypothetical protein n=1 Tax=Flammeovirga sp. OC4 TaxID=1382345 RepID=UPI0005C4F109|nr:hypothetical protein [Flammeovirga sp. OC4]
MRKLALFLISLPFIASCSKDIEPLGGNFDKVLYSESRDTLYIYHSNTNFEVYINSTNEFVKGAWQRVSMSSDGDQTILTASGLKRKACDGIAISSFPALEQDINLLEEAPEDEFVYCD